MASKIDRRIVEMRFNNSQFESGVRKTLQTIKNLKDSLNFSSQKKSLQDLGNAASKGVDMKKLESSLDAITKKFSLFGTVADQVVRNVVNAMTNTLGKGLSFVSDSIVSGGIRRAMNIENAHFQLQALLKDETKVQAVMDDAMKSVDGTAYAYDEAAKAASMFAATGMEAGDEMLNALRGIVGVSAMTNSEFSSISDIFTTVAGQGRVMGDQLLQLASRGLNAPATIAKFFNGVSNGTIKASDEVTKAVQEISQGKEVAEADIRDLVSEGMISFKIFSEAMTDAFADSAERANETFNGAFSNVKSAFARIGAEFVSPLVKQSVKGDRNPVVELLNTIRLKVNDLKTALTFDGEINGIKSLSKQFTDSVLAMAKSAKSLVKKLPINTFVRTFYNAFEGIKNIIKGVGSLLSPIAKAFKEVFLSFNAFDVLSLSSRFKELTENFKMSEESSKNLHDAFKGLFDFVKLLADGFIGLIKVIFPTVGAMGNFSGGILDVLGALGRGISGFTEWVRGSDLVKAACEGLSTAIEFVMGIINKLIDHFRDFVKAAENAGVAERAFSAIRKAAEKLGNIGGAALGFISGKAKDLWNILKNINPNLANGLTKIFDAIRNISFKNVGEGIKGFVDAIGDLIKRIKDSKGVTSFLDSLKDFAENVKAFFDFSKAAENIESFMELVTNFVDFVREKFSEVFTGFSPGNAIAGAGGLGIIYVIMQIAEAIGKASGIIPKLGDKLLGILSKTGGVLESYQRSLNAQALKDIAKAILMITGALVVLSFIDGDKLLEASIALALSAGVILKAMGSFTGAVAKLQGVLSLPQQLGKAINNLGKAAKWAAFGWAVKQIGNTIVKIVLSLVAVTVIYDSYGDAIKEALKIIGIIGGVVSAIIVVLMLLGQKLEKGAKSIASIGSGMSSLASALLIIIAATRILFKLEIPEDVNYRLLLLTTLLVGVATLGMAMGKASGMAGSGKVGATSILALAKLLETTVAALKKLFETEFPDDAGYKIVLLLTMFGALSVLMLAIGKAGQMAGGAIKGAAPILAMCVAIGAITAALVVLQLFPAEKLYPAAMALGAVLAAIAGGLFAVSYIKDEGASLWKAILSMAVTVGAITAALSLISLISWPNLIAATAALVLVLGTLAGGLFAASKITTADIWKPLVAMTANVLVIAGSLALLAMFEWPNILAAAVALSGTLTVYSVMFAMIGSMNINKTSIAAYAAGTLGLLPIAAAIAILANYSWEQMLPAVVALGAVCAELALTMLLLSKASVNAMAIAGFVAAAISLIPIAFVIKTLSGLSWEEVAKGLVTLAGALTIIGVAGMAGAAVAPGLLALSAAILVFSAAIVAIGAAILAFSVLVAKAIDYLGIIGEAISGAIGKMVEAGKNVVAGFVEGIQSGIAWIKDAATNIGNAVVEGVCNLLGIHSPSDVFDTIGQFVDSGFVQGVMKGKGDIDSTINSVFGGISEKVDVETLFGKGTEAAKNFASGIAAEEEEVGITVKRCTDPDDVDVSAYRGAATQAASEYKQGIQAEEPEISGIMKKITDATGLDMSSFTGKGNEASGNFGEGMLSGDFDLNSVMGQLTDTSSVDLSSMTSLGGDASGEFFKGFKQSSGEGAESAAQKAVNQLAKAINAAIKGQNFTASGAKVMKQLANGIKESGEQVRAVASSVATKAASEIQNKKSNFKNAATALMNAFLNGFKNKKSEAKSMATSVANAMINQFKSLESKFKDQGMRAILKFLKGIKDKKEDIKTVIKWVVEKVVVPQFKELEEKWKERGEEAAKKFLLQGFKPKFLEEFQKLKPWMIQNGKNFVLGLVEGINKNSNLAKNAARKLAQEIDQQVKTTLDIHSPSGVGKQRGTQLVEGIALGIKGSSGLAIDAARALAEALSDAFRPGDISVIDDEVINTLIKETGGNGKTKNNKEEDTSAEDAHIVNVQNYWKRLLEAKQAGSDAEKYLDMDIKEFRKSVLEETNQILDNYKEQLESTRDELMNQYSMFDTIEQKTVMSADELAKSVELQNLRYQQWDASLAYLGDTIGKDSALYKQAASLGVEYADQISELAKSTPEALGELNTQLEAKFQTMQDIAEKQLSEVKETVEQQLGDLFGTDAIDLESFQASFDGSLKSITEYIKNNMTQMEGTLNAGKAQITDFVTSLGTEIVGAMSQLSVSLGSAMAPLGQSLMTGLTNALTNEENNQTLAYDYINGVVKTLGDASKSGMTTAGIESIEALIKELEEQINASKETVSEAGTDIAEELTDGIEDGLDEGLDGLGDDLGDEFSDIGTEAGEDFGEGLEEGLDSGLDGLDEDLKQEGIEAGESFSDGVKEGVDLDGEYFYEVGEGAGSSFTEGVNAGMQTGLESGQTGFEEAGTNAADAYISGIESEYPTATSTGQEFANNAVTGVESVEDNYTTSGTTSANNYTDAIDDCDGQATSAGTSLASSAVEGLDSQIGGFKEAGSNAAKGYIDGIRSRLAEAAQAGADLANAVVENSKSELDEHSPSKVMQKIGDFAALGFLLAFNSYIAEAERAGEELGDASTNGLQTSMDGISAILGDGFDPVIRPSVDLSEVERSVTEVNELFNRAIQSINTDAIAVDANVKGYLNPRNTEQAESKNVTGETGEATYNFTQNIYSPKELSRIDIYRQTNNQLAAFRRAVKS